MRKPSLIVSRFFLLILLIGSTAVYSQPVSNGSAGALTVSGTQIVNTYGQVSNIITNSIGVYGSGFSPVVGDKVLLIQMTGANTGKWQWVEVTGGGDPFMVSYSTNLSAFSTAYGGIIQAILVPQYTSLTIPAGATLTAAPWNGTTGGILTFMVKNNFTILPGGKCDVSGLG